MENIEFEEQEQIFSQNHKQQGKITKFKQYLVSSQTIHHFVKFLFGLRAKQDHDESIPNEDALQMFRQYFGALSPDTTEQDKFKQEIKLIKSENAILQTEINGIKNQIKERRQKAQRAKQQKRLKEQQQAKNPKKAGKK